jgi:hypothetical protein
MRWQFYGIIIIFAVFVLALIFNPTLTCFGRKLKSPFYPLLRKKKRKLKTDDYGFSLGGKRSKEKTKQRMQKLGIKDNGSTRAGDAQQAPQERKRELKTDDYGFSLGEDDAKKKSEEDKE